MPKLLCRLLIYVNHALVASSLRHKCVFNAIRENKIIAKISGVISYKMMSKETHLNFRPKE